MSRTQMTILKRLSCTANQISGPCIQIKDRPSFFPFMGFNKNCSYGGCPSHPRIGTPWFKYGLWFMYGLFWISICCYFILKFVRKQIQPRMELFVALYSVTFVIVSGFDTCTAVSGRGFFVLPVFGGFSFLVKYFQWVFVSGEIFLVGFCFW